MNSKRKPRVEYSEELAEKICLELAKGKKLKDICEPEHMPQEHSVRGWARDNRCGFITPYMRARELGYLKQGEDMEDMCEDSSKDYAILKRADGSEYAQYLPENIARTKLRVETRKWILSKLLPKVFGDRVVHNVSGADDDTPIEIRDTRDVARAVLGVLEHAQLEHKPKANGEG